MSHRGVDAGRSVDFSESVFSMTNKLLSLDLNGVNGSDDISRPLSAASSFDSEHVSALAAGIWGPELKLDARYSTSRSGSTTAAFGTHGQWVIARDLPHSVLAEFYANMPVYSAHERLLDIIPRDEAPLSPHEYQAPCDIVTQYFWMLDLRDRLWAESKILEADKRKITGSPELGSLTVDFIRQAIDTVSDGLLYLENTFPDWASDYRILERQRFLLYDRKHPFKLIQPYLGPSLPPLPDYTLVERAAVRRRTLAHPFRNVPSTVSPRVVAY